MHPVWEWWQVWVSTTLWVSTCATFGVEIFLQKNLRARSFQTHLWADNGHCQCQILQFEEWKKTLEELHVLPSASPKTKCSITPYPPKSVFGPSYLFIHFKPFVPNPRMLFSSKWVQAKSELLFMQRHFLSSCKSNGQRMQKYGRYSRKNIATDCKEGRHLQEYFDEWFQEMLEVQLQIQTVVLRNTRI